ncbi:unnamed protein product [Paramecium primaurelia]|uniref:Transmembrane protein n=1 Tax=Paramecium primaurelia TaxID=5886 RepID=A0A8S1N8E8_PARPR|nr:unnamed protein product [Paramecium primaurelia]
MLGNILNPLEISACMPDFEYHPQSTILGFIINHLFSLLPKKIKIYLLINNTTIIEIVYCSKQLYYHKIQNLFMIYGRQNKQIINDRSDLFYAQLLGSSLWHRIIIPTLFATARLLLRSKSKQDEFLNQINPFYFKGFFLSLFFQQKVPSQVTICQDQSGWKLQMAKLPVKQLEVNMGRAELKINWVVLDVRFQDDVKILKVKKIYDSEEFKLIMTQTSSISKHRLHSQSQIIVNPPYSWIGLTRDPLSIFVILTNVFLLIFPFLILLVSYQYAIYKQLNFEIGKGQNSNFMLVWQLYYHFKLHIQESKKMIHLDNPTQPPFIR